MLRDLGATEPSGVGRHRRDNRKLYAELRRALHRREFALEFQPQISLATNQVRGWEALLRWPARPEGPLPPTAYLAAAERSDVANEIGGWVLAEACVEARAHRNIRVSVNVAGRQLFSSVLVRQVEAALALSGLPPGRLDLEISERIPLHAAPESTAVLTAIRGLGLGIVLDDFGLGAASLLLLHRLPLTGIKLDPSLVHTIVENENDRAIARTIIEAAHARGLLVIADGIETEPQRRLLYQLGCDDAQGFLIAPPMPPHRIWGQNAQSEGTCSPAAPAPETENDRTQPHRSRDPVPDEQPWL